MSNNLKFLLTAAAIVVVAALGSVFAALGQDWYSALITPTQWPPSVLFPIVWSVIYALAFFAIGFSLKDRTDGKRLAIVAAVNGALNVLWCLIFFTMRQPLAGLVAIILTLVAAVALVAEIYRINKIWAFIMALYTLWVSLATALNLAVWILN